MYTRFSVICGVLVDVANTAVCLAVVESHFWVWQQQKQQNIGSEPLQHKLQAACVSLYIANKKLEVEKLFRLRIRIQSFMIDEISSASVDNQSIEGESCEFCLESLWHAFYQSRQKHQEIWALASKNRNEKLKNKQLQQTPAPYMEEESWFRRNFSACAYLQHNAHESAYKHVYIVCVVNE